MVNNHELSNELLEIPSEIKMWFPIPEEGDVNFNARIKLEKIIFPRNIISSLSEFVLECLEKISGYSKPKLDGIVVGLSGGIDSSTTALRCQTAIKNTRYFLRGIIIGRGPFQEKGKMNDLEYEDILTAIRFAEDCGIEYHYIDASDIIDSTIGVLHQSNNWIKSGILPRLRSLLLLQFADELNAICAGATNGTEFLLSAFTVGGPAGHFQPFIDFYKSEVYKIAEILGVPEYVRRRKPAISELGIYDEQLYGVDCFILDPILRKMCWQKRSPKSISRELGHSLNWLRKIKELRIEGEKGRRYPPQYVVCRRLTVRLKPQIVWDRSIYFDNLI